MDGPRGVFGRMALVVKLGTARAERAALEWRNRTLGTLTITRGH